MSSSFHTKIVISTLPLTHWNRFFCVSPAPLDPLDRVLNILLHLFQEREPIQKKRPTPTQQSVIHFPAHEVDRCFWWLLQGCKLTGAQCECASHTSAQAHTRACALNVLALCCSSSFFQLLLNMCVSLMRVPLSNLNPCFLGRRHTLQHLFIYFFF